MKNILMYLGLFTFICTFGCSNNTSNPKSESVANQAKTETADSNSAAESAAVASAKEFLALVDSEKYGESWDEAAQLFKNAVSKDKWVQTMDRMRKPLGKNLSRELASQKTLKSLPGAPDGEYVVIQFKSSFENKKSAMETITPTMDKDGKWRVSGYYLQ